MERSGYASIVMSPTIVMWLLGELGEKGLLRGAYQQELAYPRDS